MIGLMFSIKNEKIAHNSNTNNYHISSIVKLLQQFVLDNRMKNKVAIFGIIVQLAGLIYGILNNAEDIIVMCLIFMFISTIALFDKKKK